MNASDRRISKPLRTPAGLVIASHVIASIVIAVCLTSPWIALAQEPRPDQVRLNLRGEVQLTTLVEYVSKRLQINFLYDDSLAQKKINMQLPEDVPVENLFDLLQSVLQINDYALAKTDRPRLYRIVNNDKIPNVAVPATPDRALNNYDRAIPLSKIIPLKRADPSQITKLLEPFLTKPGASIIPIPANRAIIVVDTASNLIRIEQLIEILDADRLNAGIHFVKVEHVDASTVAEQLQTILAARARTEGNTLVAPQDASQGSKQTIAGLEITVDERTNQLILIGTTPNVESARELLRTLDAPLPSQSRPYSPRVLSPSQLDSSLRSLIQAIVPSPPFHTRIEGNSLIVDTTPRIHEQITQLLPQIDSRESFNKQSPIRFYKIKNVPVQDLLETLNSLQFGGAGPGATRQLGRTGRDTNRPRTTNDRAIPGRNLPNVVTDQSAMPGAIPPVPPAIRNGLLDTNANFPQPNRSFDPYGNPTLGPESSNWLYGIPPVYGVSPAGPAGFPYPGMERAIQSPLGAAQVTADLGSNSLIIIAEPEVQQAYEQLIEYLDKRRPQVMIEARIVIIDTTGDFTLGVEVSGGDRSGLNRLFAFSNYGLSTVNPVTGNLLITPGDGLNATLVDPSTADFVVRALTNHRRARVLSTPKLLVDDNAEGTLESVNEIPFTSVNASQTVATTSFAGFAKAGTTITVTPTISEAKHINLDYLVTLNSFTGTGSDGVPPPRQTNEVRSRVTVPDGYTIIVGGLTQKNITNDYTGIPYLESIPILRELTGLTSSSSKDNALFIFLRPVILEEDKFRDLRDVSRRHANVAGDAHDFPPSSPLIMNR